MLATAPIASRFEDAQDVQELAEFTGRELTTAAPYRLSTGVKRAAELIEEGAIGRLQFVEICFSRKLDASRGWRGDPMRSGGGAWMQLAPAALDLAETLLGPVERLRVIELESRQHAAVEDQVLAELDHGEGRRCRVALSWNDEWLKPLAVCIGDEGQLIVGHSQLVLRRDEQTERIAPGHDPQEALIEAVREHLRRRCSLAPPIDYGADALMWIEAGYRSVRDRRWQR